LTVVQRSENFTKWFLCVFLCQQRSSADVSDSLQGENSFHMKFICHCYANEVGKRTNRDKYKIYFSYDMIRGLHARKVGDEILSGCVCMKARIYGNEMYRNKMNLILLCAIL